MKFVKWAFWAGLLTVSTGVLAVEQYPAADFQPKVIFQDPSIADASPAGTADKKSHKAEKSAQQDHSADFDPRYPAANFQPKVLFSAN